MNPEPGSLVPLLAGALLAAVLSWLGMAAALHRTTAQAHGYLHGVIPALLAVMAAGVWLGGRDLTSNFLLPEFKPDPPRPPLLDALQPAVSLLLLAVSFERILSRALLPGAAARERDPVPVALPMGFLGFWLGTTASPAVLGAHPAWSHDLIYPLVIGLAATLASAGDTEKVLRGARNSLLLLMLAGAVLIAIEPTRVLDRNYQQGWIAGLPRFGGLATHPVAMGLLAQLGLLCLLARPLPRRWLNRAAWLLGLCVLVLAQSKTAWLAFMLCSAVVMLARIGPGLKIQLAQVTPPAGVLLLLTLALLMVLTLLLALGLGDFTWIERLLNTPEGQQLASFTGRDRIWAIAWEEWQSHRAFGWGPQIWGEAYRQSIGLANATHAHNQLMDTLSRAGSVGAVCLLLYAGLLSLLALRHYRSTQGLSVALVLALWLRAGSEVPLLLMGYGPDLIAHMLLLVVLAAPHSQTAAARQREPHHARQAATPVVPGGHAA